MKKIALLTVITALISLIFSALSFLALNDISHDYISKDLLKSGKIDKINKIEDKLPEWSECRNEWIILRADFVIRIILLLLVFLLVLKVIKIE